MKNSQLNIIYRQKIAANDRTHAVPRSRAFAWVLRGIAVSALLAAYFFKYYYRSN